MSAYAPLLNTPTLENSNTSWQGTSKVSTLGSTRNRLNHREKNSWRRKTSVTHLVFRSMCTEYTETNPPQRHQIPWNLRSTSKQKQGRVSKTSQQGCKTNGVVWRQTKTIKWDVSLLRPGSSRWTPAYQLATVISRSIFASRDNSLCKHKFAVFRY